MIRSLHATSIERGSPDVEGKIGRVGGRQGPQDSIVRLWSRHRICRAGDLALRFGHGGPEAILERIDGDRVRSQDPHRCQLRQKALEGARDPGDERRILATDGRLAEEGRPRQAGAREVLDQPAARIGCAATARNATWIHSPACCQSETLGKRLNHLSSRRQSSWKATIPPGRTRLAAARMKAAGIGLVDQDASADDRIVGLGVGEGLTRALPKVDVFELGRPSPFPRDSDGLSAAIDPDDRSGGTDQLRGQHGNIARTAAQVEDPHAAADTRVPQERSVIGRKIVAWCISLRISRSECPRMYF